MAEGFLKSLDSDIEVFSAGTKPALEVNENSIAVMQEIGIDISTNKPESVDYYTEQDFDYVITVCDSARKLCPVFKGKVGKLLHIGFDDPWEAKGTREEVLNEYRRIRDEIRTRFSSFYLEQIKL